MQRDQLVEQMCARWDCVGTEDVRGRTNCMRLMEEVPGSEFNGGCQRSNPLFLVNGHVNFRGRRGCCMPDLLFTAEALA